MSTLAIISLVTAIAWATLAAFASFFVIGPMFKDRGATPIAGAQRTFFSAAHRNELTSYRARCEQQDSSLLWWRVVRYAQFGIPVLLCIGIIAALVALF